MTPVANTTATYILAFIYSNINMAPSIGSRTRPLRSSGKFQSGRSVRVGQREQKWPLGAANRSPWATSGIMHPGHPITNDISLFPSQLSLYCVISKITLLLITSCTSVQLPHNKRPSTKWDIIIMNCSCHSVIRMYFRQIHSFISETQTENVTRCQHLNISWYLLGNVRNDWTIDFLG